MDQTRNTNRGPATEAIPYMPPIRPMYAGRWCKGTVREIIKRAPEKTPAAPIPATALPKIKPVELGVIPQTKEPISNMKRAAR
jgi:hypothetical protein